MPTATAEERLHEGFAAMPLSPRLEEIAVQVRKGELPNSGRFCGNCYTPLAAERQQCLYCETAVAAAPPVGSIPLAVIEMVRAKRGRESWIVHTLAFTGLFLGTAISIAMLLAFPGWWRLAALAMLLLGTRGLAAILGGWLGDVLAYRSAKALVAEQWAAFERERAAAPIPGKVSPLNR